MRKPFAQAGKGQSGNQLSPPTLLTHLRGPSVLSYGHFGSSWARPTSGLRQPPTVPTAQTASKIASKIARLPLLAAEVLHPYRDLIEIISAVRSDKCLALITWRGRLFRHDRRFMARRGWSKYRGRCCLTRGRSTAWGGF